MDRDALRASLRQQGGIFDSQVWSLGSIRSEANGSQVELTMMDSGSSSDDNA